MRAAVLSQLERNAAGLGPNFDVLMSFKLGPSSYTYNIFAIT
jgi:hypothetical protein